MRTSNKSSVVIFSPQNFDFQIFQVFSVLYPTGTWEKDIDRVLVPGEQTLAGVFNLRPAQTYHIRIVAENEIGSSEPSDTVTILTAEEGTLAFKP